MFNLDSANDRARRQRLAYNNRFSFRSVVNNRSMVSSQDVAIVMPVAPTEAIDVAFNLAAGSYFYALLHTSTGYIQAEYWDGTTEIKGIGVPNDVYVERYIAADDPYDNLRRMKLVACDGRGNKTGTIHFLEMPDVQMINVDLTYCSNLTYGLYLNNCGLLSLQGAVSGADHVGNALYVGSNQLEQLDASQFPRIQTLDCGYNYDLIPSNIILTSNIINLGAPSIKCLGALTSAYPSWGNLQGLDISSNALSGLNASVFPQLTSLNATNNLLSSIDVQGLNLYSLILNSNQFRNLTRTTLSGVQMLYCTYNSSLNTLNASACNKLTRLDCSFNGSLTALNVTDTNLNQLYSYYNSGLSALQLSGLTGLNTLYCYNNKLRTLDLSDTAVNQLFCQSNALTSLAIGPNNTLASGIYCYNNALGTLNLSGLFVPFVQCFNNALSSINLQNANTNTLVCYQNKLSSLNVSSCSALSFLDCRFNSLTSLNVSGLRNLSYLNCQVSNYRLSALDVSGCYSLNFIDTRYNRLTALNVSGLSSLQTLLAFDNKIKDLDASGLNRLGILHCNSNLLSALNLSGCSALSYLLAEVNQLSALDLSDCTSLQEVYLYNNALTAFNFAPLTQLRNINLGVNCLRGELNLSGFNQLEQLYCFNNSISAVNFTGLSAMRELLIHNNLIRSLNIPNHPRLGIIWGYNANSGGITTSINLSGCNALSEILMYNQSLTSINVSAFDALQGLYVSNNQLSALDLTNCNNLKLVDVQFNKFTATQLDNTFFTLNSGVSAKSIYIGNNLGTNTCNRSIATARNWTVI